MRTLLLPTVSSILAILVSATTIVSASFADSIASVTEDFVAKVHVPHTHPLLFHHGRWDDAPETWWSASGFALALSTPSTLKSITLNLGQNTTFPLVALGVSINYGEWVPFNASAGPNQVPLPSLLQTKSKKEITTIRILTQMYFSSQMHLESIDIEVSSESHLPLTLIPYPASPLAFEFIGDSFSTGYTTPLGALQAWDFIVAERFKAEQSIVAQPGAALVDIFSFGNAHGMSYQFFKTEDTSYYYSTVHNYTTPWNFRRDVPKRTHVVVHIGANDASQLVPQSLFVSTYIDFLTRIRKELYPTQPFFLFTPWGWPQPSGPNAYYYDGAYQEVLDARKSMGDDNLFLVNTTGWVGYEDVFLDNLHPSVEGHAKIARLFSAWLEDWGLKPLEAWPAQ
ncbi:SGNH hydrolase [Favolaschia claudopus]|uniref:SGNH hydrolase n=1 Tax=Favolaschia claudopus TaxID=2862362 RepID=A0AAV9ZM42_9AGAR